MAARPTHLLIPLLLAGLLSAQPYAVGDVVLDFTTDICANDSGSFTLNDYDGAQNGGDYHVIWLNFFASW